jgi:predicted NBD/HSP70 family sugar kinase
MLTGTNPLYTKQYNLRLVHEIIRCYGPLTRAEIARQTELTVQTVANLTKELMALGLIRESERRRERRGPPSAVLAIQPEGAFAIGLDLDRDHLTGVLVDLAGVVRARAHRELDFPSPGDALDQLEEMTTTLLDEAQLAPDRVSGLGVGVPGLMRRADGTDYLVSPTAFPGWHDVPLARSLQERLRMPVLVENNATAAALGERWYGAGRDIGTFFYLYFGSGLGGGVIIDGRSYSGFSGNAGEVGYVPSRRLHAFSHLGTYFYMPRLFGLLRHHGTDIERPEELDRLLEQHHPVLLGWLHEGAARLTELILSIEYLLDPEAIFFGGRLPQRVTSDLVKRVVRMLPVLRMEERPVQRRYLLATAGADAGALGIAILPIYAAFAPAHTVLFKASQTRHPRRGHTSRRFTSR